MKRTLEKATTRRNPGNSATLGFEELWQAADALRGSMDAAKYKRVVACPVESADGCTP